MSTMKLSCVCPTPVVSLKKCVLYGRQDLTHWKSSSHLGSDSTLGRHDLCQHSWSSCDLWTHISNRAPWQPDIRFWHLQRQDILGTGLPLSVLPLTSLTVTSTRSCALGASWSLSIRYKSLNMCPVSNTVQSFVCWSDSRGRCWAKKQRGIKKNKKKRLSGRFRRFRDNFNTKSFKRTTKKKTPLTHDILSRTPLCLMSAAAER